MNDETREYLGDGVYAAFDGYGVVLRLNDHRNSHGEIFIEPSTLQNLNEFYKRVTKSQEAE